VGRDFRRAAENRTPAACAPRAAAPHSTSTSEFGLSSEQRLALDCFEALLKVVGLAGKVEDKIRRDIYELQQLRHTIVHRASLADRKLVDACPWLELIPGGRIFISHEQYRRLMSAVNKYVPLVIQRATAIEAAKKNP